MTTDPGDLVLDPTCGSGTTAYVAEQWGRRWITIDTSRVALALARARIMGARYPYYLLADSPEGLKKEAEITGRPPPERPTHGDIRQGFVYERVPHITLKSIANNAEIDVIWEKWQPKVEAALADLNGALRGHATPFKVETGGRAGESIDFTAPEGATVTLPSGEEAPRNGFLEWEVPRKAPEDWPAAAQAALETFWEARIARQKEIDASIAAHADFEYLYDKPYVDKSRIRVAGPFTVESLSPHRVLAVDQDDELVDSLDAAEGRRDAPERSDEAADFASVILDHLKTSGIQQAHKEDKIDFTSIAGWPGRFICAEGRYLERDQEARSAGGATGTRQEARSAGGATGTEKNQGQRERRAGIFIGPEFGTVSRPDLVAAAREAADAGFDVLVACAFNFDAHSTEFDKLGRIPVLKARMNADLHMADDLKNTGKGNLFVIFGEPDIEVTSGRWLVTRGGRRVICHERLAQLPGLGSLEEINRLGGSDLSRLKQLAKGRKVRVDQLDAPGGGVGASEYRGRGGALGNGGVSAVPERREGFAGGDGDAPHSGGSAGLSADDGAGAAIGHVGGNRAHALRSDEIAAIEALSPSDFPLSLTPNHLVQVTIHGVDVFKPQTGEVVSEGPDGIALWMIDTDYNEESFFVRHAYFLGAGDPYKALKTTLKAEIDQEAWESLRSDTSRPFDKPKSGRIAVKVINHLGDEVMKVFSVG